MKCNQVYIKWRPKYHLEALSILNIWDASRNQVEDISKELASKGITGSSNSIYNAREEKSYAKKIRDERNRAQNSNSVQPHM